MQRKKKKVRNQKKRRRNTRRRNAERLYQKLHVSYKKSGKKESWRSVAFRDISGIGMGILLNEPLKIDDRVNVLITLKGISKPCQIPARVMWCTRVYPHGYKAGLQFIEGVTHDYLINFLTEKIIDLSLDRRK